MKTYPYCYRHLLSRTFKKLFCYSVSRRFTFIKAVESQFTFSRNHTKLDEWNCFIKARNDVTLLCNDLQMTQ